MALTSLNDAISGVLGARPAPTQEQDRVIRAATEASDLVCVAYAGTGKTGTGVEIAHRLGDRRGYFVFFNRAAAREAASRLPANIQAITGHALTYRLFVDKNPNFRAKLFGGHEAKPEAAGDQLTAKRINAEFNLPVNPSIGLHTKAQLAKAILDTLERFQNSRSRHINHQHVSADHFSTSPAAEGQAECIRLTVDFATQCWSRMSDEHDPFPINQNTHLKLAQLRGTRFDADLWIIDEYQDTAPVLADLIDQQGGQKIYIGDPNQAIYGWRGAINAIGERIDSGLATYYLTESFRFNHQVAGIASLILRATGQDTPLLGQPRNMLIRQPDDPETVICRTNLSLVREAAQAFSRGDRIQLDTPIPSATKQRLLAALALYQGRMTDVNVTLYRHLGSWARLVNHSQEPHPSSQDQRHLVALVEMYGDKLPILLDTLNQTFANQGRHDQTDQRKPVIRFVTAHRSKGRQWPFVRLSEDLALDPQVLAKLCNRMKLSEQERESCNLLYVAITRAELGLSLPRKIKTVLQTLHEYFALPGDSPETFTASVIANPSDRHARILRRHRNRAFIDQHRPT